jgi:hypothetical protein
MKRKIQQSEQFQNPIEKYHTDGTVVSVSMIFLLDFGTVPTVWYFSIEFWNCFNSVVFFY